MAQAQLWMVLRPNEDGNPIKLLNPVELMNLLNRPAEHRVKQFYDLSELDADHNYWPEGAAVLLKVEVVMPEPSAGYRLPEVAW